MLAGDNAELEASEHWSSEPAACSHSRLIMLSWPQSGVTLVTPGEPRVEKDDGPALAHGTPVLLVLLRYLLDHAYALLRTLHHQQCV